MSAGIQGAGRTVLVVDDDDSLRSAVAADFRRKGFRVFEAADGQLAWECLEKESVDLVVSDIRMPVCDGIQLLDRIMGRTDRIPVVIFMTGFSDLTLEEAYARGADAVFMKPFDRKAFFAAVQKALVPAPEQWKGPVGPAGGVLGEVSFLALGRGGGSAETIIARGTVPPGVGSQVTFHAAAGKTPGFPGELAGQGTVRWMRAGSRGGGDTILGVEFDQLQEPGRTELVNSLKSPRLRAFIPQGPQE